MMVLSSSIFSMSRASTAMASLTNDSPSPLPSKATKKPTRISQKNGNENQQLSRKQRREKKPSIAQIERAFGAGSYRDSEGEMDMNTVFDELLLGHANKFEGKLEKTLREVGEMFVDRTESKLRSSGKPVLMFTLQWILPIWIVSLLFACGIIKLPFSLPLLDDLIM
ncbi:chlororespiratory reduction 3 [Raphanus sativus]|uniref:Probable NAD(P)H dehydrogenase subunit CRR3, chloroplastic n=1 Tax=Raphanus sativus TaxID=3726 RepID=A0A6J0JMW1_RAPSA|nr:probable NAD(P)H dehydrogenase subunit CRR3, chloroplastic [Raphanus sativus]KAJ4888485.1 chlororespiratory reduction 3 [Raphanus sativus]